MLFDNNKRFLKVFNLNGVIVVFGHIRIKVGIENSSISVNLTN